MRLFVAKLRYKNRDRAHPWTVFAENYANAVARLEKDDIDLQFDEIVVREVKESDAAYYGRDLSKPDDTALEHSDIVWS